MSAPHASRERIVDAARQLGLTVAITTADPLTADGDRLATWIAAGRHGEMAYLATPTTRAEPRALLPEARSVVVVALPHEPEAGAAADDPSRGAIARYARGADYHRVLKARLRELAERCESILGRPTAQRICVDTAPLLERAVAARAGLGFIGKNGLLIRPGSGSYLVLGELLLDAPLAPDRPSDRDCGRCTACLDACPTAAFAAPYQLDARRCIAYLTIELRDAIPVELRPAIGRRVAGCDVCQEVCPYNAKPRAPAAQLAADREAPALIELLRLGSAGHKRWVKGRALDRLSRNQLARNAAVALGNAGERVAVPELSAVLVDHPSPLVRGHAAWALGELGGEEARSALARAAGDSEQTVRREVAAAQERLSILAISRAR